MAVLARLLACGVAAWVAAPVHGDVLTFDVAAAKNRPVSKVITLLKDMLKQLEKEAETDEEIYDKMACWCETNDREKTKAIKDAEARISALGTKIEEYTAMSARLATEIKNTEKEVAENQAALDQATAIRQKQLAEFNAEEKDLLESISALKAAVTVLSKHHGGSLVQIPRSHMLSVAATLQHEMQKHASILAGVLTHAERKAADAFIQSPQDYFDADPTFKQSYAPASGEIFGILKQMKETFESNLSAAQKEEMANQKAYEDLKAAKEAEIAAGQAQIDTKTQELADTDEKLAMAKQDIEDTRNSLAADEQFLMMLKEKCAMTDKEWEERQKTRQEEMEAVSKALAVLSSDDAHDLFTRTFSPAALLQKASTTDSKKRQDAAKLLSSVASKLHSPRLATLATQVRLDAFTRVKKAIDDMIAQLLKEKEDEIKHKDFCVDEFNTNQLQTEKKEREKADLEAKIAALVAEIKELTEAIDTLKQEIVDLKFQMKRAGEDREKENADFQVIVSDQRATMSLLTAALEVLKGYYTPVTSPLYKPELLQQEPRGPPPPPGFETYKKSGGSPGVMELIEQIINDSKKMEAEAIRAEEDAQTAYESYVKETNESINAKNADIVDKSLQKAVAEQDLAETKASHEGVMLTSKTCRTIMRNCTRAATSY
jgi:ABC-type cobalt transport system substrate-binding protein